MEKQNITLALPKELLRRFKRLAMDHEKSVNGLLRELMEDALSRGDSYEKAYQHWREDMSKVRDLGTRGKRTWTRDELHDRR